MSLWRSKKQLNKICNSSSTSCMVHQTNYPMTQSFSSHWSLQQIAFRYLPYLERVAFDTSTLRWRQTLEQRWDAYKIYQRVYER